ncbi:hypothetical protein [uncultured Aquimarina sp.]|nr:hypothetical protein [uncultured Aquimarina sp.]
MKTCSYKMLRGLAPEKFTGKYRQIPVGLFAGIPQLSIPIHEF